MQEYVHEFIARISLEKDQLDIPSKELVSKCLFLIQQSDYTSATKISDILFDRADEILQSIAFKDITIVTRKRYEIASILKAIILNFSADKNDLIQCIRILDNCLLMTGCPIFKMESLEWIEQMGKILPKNYEPCILDNHQFLLIDPPIINFGIKSIDAPTVIEFSKILKSKQPVVIKNAILDWPAIHSWQKLEYFKDIAWCTVPVEIGLRYTDSNWTQKLISMDDFIKSLCDSERQKIYLAQFNLLEHIPRLENDIITPDYCYVKDSDPQINAWIGPKGTISPCHTDPYDNIFAQVVGYKYVRLYSPESNVYPFEEETLMSNTSQVDIENPDTDKFPNFKIQKYQDIILEAGDLLYIPNGWWHYVRSLTISCSVSFWI